MRLLLFPAPVEGRSKPDLGRGKSASLDQCGQCGRDMSSCTCDFGV